MAFVRRFAKVARRNPSNQGLQLKSPNQWSFVETRCRVFFPVADKACLRGGHHTLKKAGFSVEGITTAQDFGWHHCSGPGKKPDTHESQSKPG